MDDLLNKIDRLTETILDNERLTADLNDQGASALIEWAVDCVRRIVISSAQAGSSGEAQVQERIRAVRRLMRLMNRWVKKRRELDDAAKDALLDQLIEQSGLIHGERYIAPNRIQKVIFLRLDRQSTFGEKQIILDMRRLLESPMMIYTKNGDDSNASQ